MKGQIVKTTQTSLLAAALFAVAIALPGIAAAGNPNPGILPMNSSPGGKTYGEWTEAWWQWALGIPAAVNPVEDATGQYADEGQSGPVWFLGSTFGDLSSPVVRTFTIPAGKTLFLPVYQWIFGASVGDCDPSNPGIPCDIATLRASAAAAATSVLVMEVSIDDVAVQDIRSYRAFSPDGFSVTFPQDAVFGLPAGTFSPQVADGYWLMLAPLKAGAHTITVHVIPDPNLGTEFQIIYNLTVKA